MKPGDYIIKKYTHNEANIWYVTGVFLGGLGHQDCVGIIPINRKSAFAYGSEVEEMIVPIDLVEPYLVESRNFP